MWFLACARSALQSVLGGLKQFEQCSLRNLNRRLAGLRLGPRWPCHARHFRTCVGCTACRQDYPPVLRMETYCYEHAP